jgi:hypothetical protein
MDEDTKREHGKDEDMKRRKIQKYFKYFPGWTIALLVFGVLFLFIGLFAGWAAIFGVIFIIIGIVGIASQSGKPTDSQVDDWLELDRKDLEARSKSKLGMDKSQIVSDPYELFIWTWQPSVADTCGIPAEDIKAKRGKMSCEYPHFFYNLWRHSAWRFQIFYPTEHYLASYGCWFDFLRGKFVNERTAEIYYKDITILETSTSDRIDTKRKGLKESEFETFRLKVSSGDTIEVNIPSEYYINQALKDNLSEVPSTRCEKMVQSMRKMIQAKKS